MYKQVADPLRRSFLLLKEAVSHLKPLSPLVTQLLTRFRGQDLPASDVLRICSGDKVTARASFYLFPFFISFLSCPSGLFGLPPGSALPLWDAFPSVGFFLILTTTKLCAQEGTGSFKCPEYKDLVISLKCVPQSPSLFSLFEAYD